MELLQSILSSITSPTGVDLFLPVLAVLVTEHIILRYWYNKQSSIDRIIRASKSAKTDSVAWFLYYVAFRFLPAVVGIIALPGVVYLLAVEIKQHFEIHGVFGNWMPENMVFAVLMWAVVYDFPAYVTHWLMHKVPFFWTFHRYHHAAEEMNVITGTRVSLAEYYLGMAFHLGIAAALLGLENPGIPFYALLLRRIIDLIQHSDLPWGYSWFGYLVASPRFHRIHHSSDVNDYDSNFGNIFSFWDFIFRTHNRRYEADRSVADTCPLGLPNAAESRVYNDPVQGIFRETFVHWGLLFLRWIAMLIQRLHERRA